MPCALVVHLSIAYGVWGGASGALEGGVLFQGAVQDYQSVRTMEVFSHVHWDDTAVWSNRDYAPQGYFLQVV